MFNLSETTSKLWPDVLFKGYKVSRQKPAFIRQKAIQQHKYSPASFYLLILLCKIYVQLSNI